MAKKKLPKFADEAEEARWYYAHRDELEDYFDQLSEQVMQALLARLPPREAALAQAKAAAGGRKRATPTSIRLPPADIAAAKAIAAREGLGYQTWIKTVVHRAIEAEQTAGRTPRDRARRSGSSGGGRA